jgi:eukaryotic-like serine/threonine-protein kinase
MSDVAPSAAPTRLWQPGAFPTLLERYQILGIIGQGGMGTVFKGYHTNLKRFVAIKTLRVDRTKRPELVHRFLREMEAIGQMDHPNVVRASDAGEKNGVLHLVMEYLIGLDLGRLVADRGRLEVVDACELTRQAALGLDYIHQTLVHRDIKPSNLMLTSAGLVKILDLGLARLHDAEAGDGERTPEGCVMGSYDYLAPEQATASTQVDGRADQYSLGCTLFKLLTGRAPFSGPEYDTLAKKLFAHCQVPLTAVEHFNSLPEGLRPVLLRMTAKDAGERYPTAREVAGVLAPFAVGSRPLQLLGELKQAAETAVQPLPHPLTEELSRLTIPPHDTPMNTPAAHAVSARARPRGKRRVLLAAGILTCAVAASASLVFRSGEGQPDKLQRTQPDAAPGRVVPSPGMPTVRLLDTLRTGTLHRLLDQPPLPVGCASGDARAYRWDAGENQLKVEGDGTLLFLLGTTSRSRFGFEAGLRQLPWSGNAGIFWGYKEDASLRAAARAWQKFAWFQMMVLRKETGKKLENRFFVQRARGSLFCNQFGDIVSNLAFLSRHDVLMPTDETILKIEVESNRLRHAWFGSVNLEKLFDEDANKVFRQEPYAGGLGLITDSTSTVFSDVRFILRSDH